jgi:hypothetical protein
MARGGSRQGAGRKSTWTSGCTFKDTTLIRVPLRLALTLLELAHKLDEEETIDSITKSQNQELTVVEFNLTSIEDTQSQQRNDLVMESETLSTVEKEKPETPIQLELLTQSTETNSNLELVQPVLSNPVSGKLLARRLGVNPPLISDKKKELSRAGFYDWLQSRDPNNIRWKAVGKLKSYSKGYLPSEDTSPDLLKKLQDWLEKNK